MQELIGKQFSLGKSTDQDSFRIVDVRNLSGNYMVYAEQEIPAAAGNAPRRAFHFEDIAHLLTPVSRF